MASPTGPERTWLVTGGAGFLGRIAVARLLGQGHRVRILDQAARDDAVFPAHERLDYHHGDIADRAVVDAATRDADHVLHAAAALPIQRKRAPIERVNLRGTQNVLDSAQRHGARSVVFTSTTAVYGLHKTHPITEDSPLIPIGPYGETKVAAEARCQAARDEGLHVSVLRPKTFLGPGRLGVFEILFDWIADGKRIPLIGKGHNRYQLLHVDDLLDAILTAATHPKGNDTYNIAAKDFGTLREDLAPLFAAAGHPVRFLPLPRRTTISGLWALDKLHLSPLSRWHYGTMSQDSYVEVDKARTHLGWAPKHSNRATLLSAYEWYHAHRDEVKRGTGVTHTVAWDQGVLGAFKRFA